MGGASTTIMGGIGRRGVRRQHDHLLRTLLLRGDDAIGQWTSRYHPQLFVIGGLMMLFTAVTLCLWTDLIGWKGDPHLSPFHLASYVFIIGGFWLIATAWRHLYKARRAGTLATDVRASVCRIRSTTV